MLNNWLIAITIGLFSLNFTPVLAQQMLIQVVGGGYRFDGPNTIAFDAVDAAFTSTDSEKSVRAIVAGGYTTPPVGTDGFISIDDQNGGAEFQVQISASGNLDNKTIIAVPPHEIPLTNFQVQNISAPILGPGEDITTINGRSDGLSLNAAFNTYRPISTSPQTLATGTGQMPGEWKFYPQFRIQVPEATALGIYETTLTFTII